MARGGDELPATTIAGRWLRLHRGVYAHSGTPDSFELRAAAALAALPLAVLSHRASCRVLSLGVDEVYRCIADQVLRSRTTLARVERVFGDVAGRGRQGRVDFWYPGRRLIVELDGRRFHLRAAEFESDRRRDQLGLVHGVRTARFTHRQLTTEVGHVAEVMSSLLGVA